MPRHKKLRLRQRYSSSSTLSRVRKPYRRAEISGFTGGANFWPCPGSAYSVVWTNALAFAHSAEHSCDVLGPSCEFPGKPWAGVGVRHRNFSHYSAARPPTLNPAPSPLLAQGIPGIAPPRDHDAGAYSDPPADNSQEGFPDANARALQSIARSLNEREDSTTQERGKVGSIGKRRDAYTTPALVTTSTSRCAAEY